MRLYYDFHIHSALSPCADDDMTPYNIVNMARIKGLDAIAITDHNSAKNVRIAMKAGEGAGVKVIAGIEITTAEDVHILSLFPTADAAEEVAEVISKSLPDIKNRADIFGRQLIFDENDNVVGEESALLMSSSSLSVDGVFLLVRSVGGVAVPAHIDRSSFSIISNLGFIPESLGVTAVEISSKADENEYIKSNPMLWGLKVLRNSDAHNLGNISERKNFVEILNNKTGEILSKFI